MFLTNFNFYKFRFDKIKNVIMIHLVFSSVVKRLSRILDMDESAVQLCAELPVFLVPWWNGYHISFTWMGLQFNSARNYQFYLSPNPSTIAHISLPVHRQRCFYTRNFHCLTIYFFNIKESAEYVTWHPLYKQARKYLWENLKKFGWLVSALLQLVSFHSGLPDLQTTWMSRHGA